MTGSSMQHDRIITSPPPLWRMPLLRLLAINLAIGVCAAALLVGGLLWLNPGGLRDLIFADRAPAVPILVLLGSFVITFGSVAMGTAIMALGRSERPESSGGGGGRELAVRRLAAREH